MILRVRYNLAGAIQGALYFSATGASNDDSIGDLPNLPVPISYPQYGGFTLLPLEGPDYAARVSTVDQHPCLICSLVKLHMGVSFAAKQLVVA